MNKKLIESWWRHNGCYERQQTSPFYWDKAHERVQSYLNKTDDWWNGLTDEEKEAVYVEFRKAMKTIIVTRDIKDGQPWICQYRATIKQKNTIVGEIYDLNNGEYLALYANFTYGDCDEYIFCGFDKRIYKRYNYAQKFVEKQIEAELSYHYYEPIKIKIQIAL